MSQLSLAQIPMAQTRALRQQVLRPHQTLDEIAAGEPADAYAVGAFLDARLIAVGFIAPGEDPGVWRVRGMATEPNARGGGAGSAILNALVGHALDAGAVRVWCSARTPALSLYERAGFTAASEVFEEPHIGPHVIMERTSEILQR